MHNGVTISISLTAIRLITTILTIVCAVAYPRLISQTMIIFAKESFAILFNIQTSHTLIAAIHALPNAVAHKFHWNAHVIQQARKFVCIAFNYLMMRHIIFTIVLVIVWRTIVMAIASKILNDASCIVFARVVLWRLAQFEIYKKFAEIQVRMKDTHNEIQLSLFKSYRIQLQTRRYRPDNLSFHHILIRT